MAKDQSDHVEGPNVAGIVTQQGSQHRQSLVKITQPKVSFSQVLQQILGIGTIVVVEVVRQSALDVVDRLPLPPVPHLLSHVIINVLVPQHGTGGRG